MGYLLGGAAAIVIIVVVAGAVDKQAAIPTQEEIQNLEDALPEGCIAHDIGSYGKIDTLIVVECEGSQVTSSIGYMHQQNGKVPEVDFSAVFIIDRG
jgi:hypothetical protein